jgi:hypothetical protein
MQVIKPAQYGLFKAFTEQIDSAERSQVQVKNARQRS